MSSFEKAEENEIAQAMARAAGYDLRLVDEANPELGWTKKPHPAVPKAVKFVFHAIREYDFPFGIYKSEPPIAPTVRHINRHRHGEGWTNPPEAA